jgi:hypothetical protein
MGMVSRHTALVFLALLSACGGDENRPSTTGPGNNNDPDAGDASGSEPYDGSVPLPRRDGGIAVVPPGEPETGLNGECAVDSNKIYTVAQRSQPFTSSPLAVDPVNSRFIMPFVDSGECLDTLHMAALAGAAASGEPQNNDAIETCALVRESAATALTDRWLIATTDNREAPYDIWLTPYELESNAIATPQRITESSQVETGVALATLATGKTALLAYADEDLDNALGQALYVRPLDNLGKPTGEAVKLDESTELYFTNLSIRKLGQGAGLVYVRYALDYSTSDIVFVALDAQGAPLREKWVLARSAGPSPSVDLTVDDDGGGIVYARAEAMTGRQIWFQQIDTSGQAALQRTGSTRAPAVRIVNSPQRGTDVSITQLRASFVILYRQLPQMTGGRALLRAYFLDRFGAIVGSSDVSYTSTGGGRTSVQASGDGRVAVAWNELTDDGGSALKVARLPCVGN